MYLPSALVLHPLLEDQEGPLNLQLLVHPAIVLNVILFLINPVH